MPAGVRIRAQRLQHVRGKLPPDDQLNTGAAGQRHVFHARKAGTVALDHVHELIILIDAGKDAGLERLVARRFQESDRLFRPVAVQIGQLDRLLVHAGDRRGVGRVLAGHDLIDGLFQPVIFIRVLRERVQLVDGLDKAAGQDQRHCRGQHGQQHPFHPQPQRKSPFSHKIQYNMPGCKSVANL